MSDQTVSDYTVSDLAKVLGRSRDSITSLITSGKLEAYDAAPEGRYRQWRVTPQSLDKFRTRNAAKPKVKSTRKRLPVVVKEFI